MPIPESTPADRMSTYWATLRRHTRLVAALVGAAVLAGIGVGLLAPKAYDATAKAIAAAVQVYTASGKTDQADLWRARLRAL